MPTSETRQIHNVLVGQSYPGMANFYACSSVAGLRKTWYRSANFRQVPRRDLAIQPYNQERWLVEQPVMVVAEAFNLGDGSLHQRDLDGFQYDVLEGLIISYAAQAQASLRSSESQLNEVALSCLLKIGDAKVNLPVALAEAHKTVDLILGTANRIYRAYRSFRKGNLREVANQLNISPRRVHKSWLEYKYGWMPLLMDVKGAAEFYAQHHFPRPPYFHAASKSIDKFHADTPGAIGGLTEGRIIIDFTRECRVGQDVQASSPMLARSQQLGLTNPLSVAWELVPFSFVFDWFIHVGDYLQGLTALNGLEILRGYSSFTYDLKAIRDGQTPSSDDGSFHYTGFKSSIKVSYRQYVRTPFIVSPGSLYPPRSKSDSFGFGKMITSLALLRSTSR